VRRTSGSWTKLSQVGQNSFGKLLEVYFGQFYIGQAVRLVDNSQLKVRQVVVGQFAVGKVAVGKV
jgi:hypothetical protein